MSSTLKQFEKLLEKKRQKLKGIEEFLAIQELPETRELREKYQNSLRDFVIDSWDWASTEGKFVPNYATDAFIEVGNALLKNQIKVALIVAPPRNAKSTFFMVQLPAWEWTFNPSTRYMTGTYCPSYAERDNINMQLLIKSKWYQTLFGNEFELTTQNAKKTKNSCGGQRIVVTPSSKGIGEGATRIFQDDLNNVDRIQYKSERQKCWNFIDRTLMHRQNDPKKSSFLFAQHRSHEEDVIQYMLDKKLEGTILLNLQMEYEKRNHCTVRVPNTDHIIWTDHRQNEGELLAPDRYTPENIAFFKKSMGANNYSALFQGRPTAETGGVFEKEWFNVWTESFLPPFELTLQCWDTAVSTTAEASYSCATTYGVFIHQGERHLMLISMFLDKLEYPDLKAMVLRMSRSYEDSNFYASPVPYRAPPTYTIIENKSSGQCLLSDLKRMGVQAIGYNPPSTSGGQYGLPGEGKIVRARMRSPVVKENRVWVRGLKDGKLMRMSETFLHACATFPNSGEGNMDIVDTFSMALDWLDRHKYFMPTGDIRSRDDLRTMMKHFENSSFPASVDNIPNANIRGMFDNFQLPEFKK